MLRITSYLIPHVTNYIVLIKLRRNCINTTFYEIESINSTPDKLNRIIDYLWYSCFWPFVFQLLLAIRGPIVIAYLWHDSFLARFK